MKLFERAMDWIETRPLWQICVWVLLAFAMLVAVSECMA